MKGATLQVLLGIGLVIGLPVPASTIAPVTVAHAYIDQLNTVPASVRCMASTRISRTVKGSIAAAFSAKAEAIAAAISFGINEGDLRAVRNVIEESLLGSGAHLSDETVDIVEHCNSHQGHQHP